MPHPALLFILLLIPNTTLRDWQAADAPHLHALLREGSVALMNARTAERDEITTVASCHSLGAGARMNASDDAEALQYSVLPGNLGKSLQARGVFVRADDATARMLLECPPNTLDPDVRSPPTLVVATLRLDSKMADAVIGTWVKTARSRRCEIMAISTNPSRSEYRASDQLVPVVLWESGAKPGLLFSPSTRHTGLVTNTDVAPTIAAAFDTPLLGPVYGAPLHCVPNVDENGPQLLERADAMWMAQARSLRAMPYIAGALAAVVALITGATLRGTRGMGAFALLVTLIPFVLILSGTVPIAASLLISASACTYLFRDRLRQGLLYVGALTAALVVGDALCSGGAFTGASLLGYSPLEGARYYGIGNEAMGAVIGAAIALTAGLLPRRDGRLWCALIWIVITAALAWPTAGAKAGGLLVGLISLAALFAASSGRSWRDVRVWGGLAAALALGVAGLFLLGRYGARSHLTQAVESAGHQGGGVYGSLVIRKGLMDAHLVLHSVWIWVLIAAIGGGYLTLRKQWPRLTQTERASVLTGCAATAACLTLNDAGVVAAAVCSCSLWAVCVSLSEADDPEATPR